MPTFKRRDKILLFRLTQEEYDRLLTACQKRGGRSLSDFARTQLLQRIDDGPFYKFNQQIFRLESAVKEVTGLLEEMSAKKRK
ncbi:MAG: hypothetical protein FJW20_11720 [Acidimicrobiia bacterium]|nr:hypothetical protein [Acidimicrobiia bacterium]